MTMSILQNQMYIWNFEVWTLSRRRHYKIVTRESSVALETRTYWDPYGLLEGRRQVGEIAQLYFGIHVKHTSIRMAGAVGTRLSLPPIR
jgi:hypothetical protein